MVFYTFQPTCLLHAIFNESAGNMPRKKRFGQRKKQTLQFQNEKTGILYKYHALKKLINAIFSYMKVSKQQITTDISNLDDSGIDTASARSFMETTVTSQMECKFHFI